MVCVVDLIVPPLFVVLISLRIFHCPDEVRKEYCSVRQSVQGLKGYPIFLLCTHAGQRAVVIERLEFSDNTTSQ